MKKIWLITFIFVMAFIIPMQVFGQSGEEHPAFRNVEVSEKKIRYQIEGEARVFEGTLQYRVKADNQVIASGFETAAGGAPAWATFTLDFTFDKEAVAGKDVVLELYELSAKDGSEINNLVIPMDELENNNYQNNAFRQVGGTTDYLYKVNGEARVWEATYLYSLEDGHNILRQGHGTASTGAPDWGTFEENFVLSKNEVPVNGTIVLTLYVQNQSDEGPPYMHHYYIALDQYPW